MNSFLEILAIIITSIFLICIITFYTTLRTIILNFDEKLKLTTSHQQYEIIQQIVKISVSAGNQILKNLDGTDKLNEVFKWSMKKITDMGIPVSDESLRIIIEASVNEQKKTQKLLDNILGVPDEERR